MKKTLQLSIIILFMSVELSGQSNCQEALSDALRNYYNGNLREVMQIESCINRLSKNQRIEAFKIMTSAQLLLGEDEMAQINMSKLLKVSPDYRIAGDEIEEFRKLYETYNIYLNHSIGIIAGSNLPDHKTMHYRSLGGYNDQSGSYVNRSGYVVGFQGSRYFLGSMSVVGAIMIQNSRYQASEVILDFREVSILETQTLLSVPIQLKYEMILDKFRPFVSAGAGVDYLVGSKADLRNTPLPSEFPIYQGNSELVQDYEIGFQRKRLNLNLVGTLGMDYLIGLNRLSLMLSYCHGLNNLVDVAQRNDEQLIEQYGYIPDDFKRNLWQLTIGFSKGYFKSERRTK